MRILLVGAGGVGAAFAAIAARRDFFEHVVVADHDPARAERAVGALETADPRFSVAAVDASAAEAVTRLSERGRPGPRRDLGRGGPPL